MFGTPERSYRGPLPPLTASQQESAKRLSDHVWLLAGDIGARSLTSAPDNLERAGAYIEHVFRSSGYAPRRQEFPVEVLDQREREMTSDTIKFAKRQHAAFNIICEKQGTASSEGLIVVGAHYDSVYDCPAANDNGSGVAALLEIAHLLREESLAKTIRFVAFTNEEPPFFRSEEMGSYQYARSCRNANERIDGMICLETVGFYTEDPGSQNFPHPIFGLAFPTKGNFVSFISNIRSAPLLKRCVRSFRKNAKFPSEAVALPSLIPGVDFSDHYNFWRFDYPAIMVTDTAFYRYPHYHEQEDTPDKLNYENLSRVVSGLAAVVKELCA